MTDDTPAVPAPASRSGEDHALVPRDPTPEMVEAGRAQMIDGGKMQTHARIMWVWEAMLKAAPALSRDSGEAVKDVADYEAANAIGHARMANGKRIGDVFDETTRMNIVLAITEANPWRIVRSADVLALSASAARLTADVAGRDALIETLMQDRDVIATQRGQADEDVARLAEDNVRLRTALECGLEVTQIAINALGPNSLCAKELTATLTRHREALRISPSPEEGQTWQPIADAPKDREIVYLWKSEGHVGRCRWSDERGWACWWDIDGDQEAHATHYIPMPSLRGKAPADGAEEGRYGT